MSQQQFYYELEAARVLNRLQQEASDRLWDRLCDAIDLIVDHSDSREARGEQLRARDDKAVWKVDIFDGMDDWAILRHHDQHGAVVIAWIGPWPPT